MRYASVCDGIGAVHVAWKSLDWACAWIAEIDAFANAVTARHWSYTNLGDITRITEADLERHGAIDLLVGGTPCQSFSVAGLRKGMDDPRGNLALRFCQLVDATRPDWVLWENVPGVLSVDGGRAFGTFLGALAKLGYGFAYGILDAQYFGVPQRRRRVFVVGHSGDWRPAAAVLFERESMSRNSPPSEKTEAEVAAALTQGTDSKGKGGYAGRRQEDDVNLVAATLTGGLDGHAGLRVEDTLVLAQNGSDIQVGHQLGAVTAGQARQTSGDLIAFHARQDPITSEQSLPLEAKGGQSVAYGLAGETLPPLWAHRCDNCGHIFTSHEEFVACPDCRTDSESFSPIMNKEHAAIAYGWVGDVTPKIGKEVMPTLRAEQGGEGRGVATGGSVRRLTPRECERLQGFPDDYTRIPWRGKSAERCPDGPRYRVLGNSMAVPVMEWIGQRIVMVDGIGKIREA